MNKLIEPGSFNFPFKTVEIAETYLDRLSKDWIKSASVKFDSFETKKAHSYLHVNAVGAGQRYSANNNADWFDDFELAKYHDTFVKNGHVYSEHNHFDPSLAKGMVKASAYNDKMGRVELIIEVPNNNFWQPFLHKIAKEDDHITFSMGCKVAHDVCSICGNKAANRS